LASLPFLWVTVINVPGIALRRLGVAGFDQTHAPDQLAHAPFAAGPQQPDGRLDEALGTAELATG